MYPALPNLPVNPTFHHPSKPQLLIQLNIFHFQQNIYPQPLILYSHHYLTPHLKFHPIHALVTQINHHKQPPKYLLPLHFPH
ncbi:riboflavin kinase, partial [Staphylococcus hominis]|uniref:riboflavin kinase n=1 Tax=Staphylococcus hominis TaxID=1290 RepID=UPI003709564C